MKWNACKRKMCKFIVSQTHFLEVLREVKWVEHWTNDMTGRFQSEIGRPIEEYFFPYFLLCVLSLVSWIRHKQRSWVICNNQIRHCLVKIFWTQSLVFSTFLFFMTVLFHFINPCSFDYVSTGGCQKIGCLAQRQCKYQAKIRRTSQLKSGHGYYHLKKE